MPYKNREKQLQYMRDYQKRNKIEKAKLEDLLKKCYDPFMDSVVISRHQLEQLHFTVT